MSPLFFIGIETALGMSLCEVNANISHKLYSTSTSCILFSGLLYLSLFIAATKMFNELLNSNIFYIIVGFLVKFSSILILDELILLSKQMN